MCIANCGIELYPISVFISIKLLCVWAESVIQSRRLSFFFLSIRLSFSLSLSLLFLFSSPLYHTPYIIIVINPRRDRLDGRLIGLYLFIFFFFFDVIPSIFQERMTMGGMVTCSYISRTCIYICVCA